jgi:SSS family solute:Na+ symporter/sodium/proline symporter
MQVQIITVIALVLFSAVMVAIGLYSARHTKTMDGFLLGNRNIGAWMSAFAYGTSYFSAVIFIGYAGKHGWDIGMAAMWIGVGNAVLGCLLAWKVLAKRTRAMTHTLNVKTMPEFFEGRYGSPRFKIFSAVIIFIFLVPYSAAVYKGLGTLFNTIFPDISVNMCMLFVAALTAFFLVLGGYVASVYTDFVQGIIMIAGVVVMVVIVALNPSVGGLPNMMDKLRLAEPSLTHIFGGDKFSFLAWNILLTSFGTWGLPQMVSKFYAVKDSAAIKRATVVSTLFALLIGVGAYFVGSTAHLVLGGSPPVTAAGAVDYDNIIPQILMRTLGNENVLTTIVLAVVLVLLLSASMSTLSAVVLTSSSAVSVDLMPVIAKKSFNEKNQMWLMRGLCLLFVALSYVFATFNIAIIVSIMSFSWGAVSGAFIGPYLWGLYSKRITKAGAWAGMIGGFGMLAGLVIAQTIIADFNTAAANAPMFGVAAMAVSLIATPLVSLFTKKLPEEITSVVE